MACHAYLGYVLEQQGYSDAALSHAEKAIAAARAAAHPFSEAFALSCAAILHQRRGEVALCLARAEAALALATEQVLPFHVTCATVVLGWALVQDGQPEEWFAPLRAGLDAYRASDDKVHAPNWLALLAEACLETGRIEEGLSAMREALAVVEEAETRHYEAELKRLEGELLLASGEPDEKRAEASFREAIEIARAQQARSFELRAATSLSRLLAPREAQGSARPSRADPRLVCRRLRHRRSERSEGTTQPVAVSRTSACPRMAASSAITSRKGQHA
jgi:predicted ATPase